jgi:pseudouridine kinase
MQPEPAIAGAAAPQVEVACFGGLNLDRQGRAPASVVAGSSNPVAMRSSVGGVAANVARGLAALGRPTTLIARVGPDAEQLRPAVASLAAPLLIVDEERPTASYTTLIEPDGRLFVGLADMDVHDHWTHADIDHALRHADTAGLWFVDANLPDFAIARLSIMARGSRTLAANGVSARKAQRLAGFLDRIGILFANAEEAIVLGVDPDKPRRGPNLVTVVTHGAAGLAVAVGDNVSTLPAPPLPGPAVDETGAGDCLIAGTLAGRLAGLDWPQALALGLSAAAAALCSADAVPEAELKALASLVQAG